ncbi:hypothetical protein LWI29_011409 [Acer saccharum]|uniref:C-JID domain-containing protein n=1 Tax=Acer saccharum TaxID=4024 RepID=A0AA39T4A0_ACESA|nr:hypothetical protein LWI29_011409 [Acer saccharum]
MGFCWNKGTKAVEGISLHMDSLMDVHLSLSCRVFDKMPNLRLLLFTHRVELYKVHLPNGLNSLPDELMILEWHRYPLRALPSNFSPAKLVKLDLSVSNIEQLWEGTKHAPKLKWLILNYCQHLTRIPNLSRFLSLEEVDLTGCKSLVGFPSSVQQLNELRYLSLDGCSNVTKFPLTSGSEEPPTHFSICLPGSEIPEWFTYQSSGSSVNIQVLRQDLVNRKFMGFAICAVLRIEEYHIEHQFLGVRVNFHFETYDDYISFPLHYHQDGYGAFINSDHILLGFSSFSIFDYLYQNLEKLFSGDRDYVDISFEIKARIEDYKMKHYAVHPIYA